MADQIETPAPVQNTDSAETKPQNFYDSWNLDDESKGFIQASGYKEPLDVIKSLRDTKKYVGADKNTVLRIPHDEANVEGWNDVYKKLGRPDDPKEYGLADSEVAQHFAPVLHELGLTKSQAVKLQEAFEKWVTTENTKQVESAETISLQQVNDLKKEWGNDFEQNKAVADSVIHKMGVSDDELKAISARVGIKRTAQLFYNIGKENLATHLPLSDGAPNERTSVGAKYKLETMLEDPEIVAKIAKKDYKTINEVNRLTEIIHKGQGR